MLNNLTLLPLEESELADAIDVALDGLESAGLSKDEARLKLESAFGAWIEAEGEAPALPAELRPLIANASWAARTSRPAHTVYVELIRRIQGSSSVSRRAAVLLASRLPLVLLLAGESHYSPAGIARLIGSNDAGGQVGWKAVRAILSHFRINHELEEGPVAALLGEDRQLSEKEFGDADCATTVELISAGAMAFGMDDGFHRSLARLLAPDDGRPFFPYLQMLMYVAVVDHFYDHPSEYIYTFKPRGRVAGLIFGSFPSGLAPRGNPILNNFKAVNRLTHDWAESRDDNREQAESLVRIVLGLSSLPYPARKRLSAIIRRGLFRLIDINTPTTIHWPDTGGLAEVERFLENVSSVPTNTRGIIEQRVTDFLGAMAHRGPDWRSRGLGDPVNASNTASRKLGDCDFQHAGRRECHAYESHAGRLTDVYLNEHTRTLRLNLPAREAEWNAISDIGDWSIVITFIAHEDARSAGDQSITTDVPC